MVRAVVHLLPVEMALLGAFEFLVSLVFVYLMLSDGAALFGSVDLCSNCVEIAGAFAVIVAGAAAGLGLYRHDVCLNRRRCMIACSGAGLLAFPAILLVSVALDIPLNSDDVLWLAQMIVVWVTLLMIIRFGFTVLTPGMPIVRQVLIIGSGAQVARLRQHLLTTNRGLFRPICGDASSLRSSAYLGAFPRSAHEQRIWAVVVADNDLYSAPFETMSGRGSSAPPVFSATEFQEVRLGRIDIDCVDLVSLTGSDGGMAAFVSNAIKRLCDIALAAGLLIVTLPLLLAIALLVKLDSPGPVFYRQERVGLRGKTFILLKLRSMTVNAEAVGLPQWAQKQDPRVTRVGKFIRATRIDELPQLINVLSGEMSIVGPRPERPLFVEELSKVIPPYNLRSDVKPGLTGWAQVNYPYGASFEDAREKLAYDLYYVKNRGVLLDLMILLSTVRVVLFCEGSR